MLWHSTAKNLRQKYGGYVLHKVFFSSRHFQQITSCAWGITLATLLAWGGVAQAEIERASLMRDLTELASPAMEGRATATAGAEKARHFLIQRLQQLGVQACQQSYLQSFEFSRGGRLMTGQNIVACLPAADNPEQASPALLLAAHYDHLGMRQGKVHPGADDNASGVAALLALAQEILQKPLNRPVILAFFDAEEMGLLGSWAFVNHANFAAQQLAFMVNLDMVGRGDKGELYASGSYHFPALSRLVEHVAAQAETPILRLGHDRPEPAEQDWTKQSDHFPFFSKGVPYLYFGVEDHADYHGPGDSADKIPEEFYYASVRFLQRLIYRIDADLSSGSLQLTQKAASVP